jgi:VWFA-related protein
MRLRFLGAFVALAGVATLICGAPGSLSAANGTSGSAPGQSQGEQGVIRSGVRVVNLYATVRDNHKAIVANLEQKDFRIFEDNVEQKVAFFSRESSLPLTMGILLDTSGSESAMIGAIQQAAGQFLGRVMQKNKDEAMVITFDMDVNMLSDWTSDLAELNRAVRRAKINTGGASGMVTPGPFPTSMTKGTVFYDAVYLACHDKMSSEAGRKALVVMTDAEDEGSDMKLKDAIEAAQRADTVVQMLVVYDPHFGADFSGARKIAEETGGRAIDVRNDKELLKAFDEISEEMRSEYQLGYYPTNAKYDGTFRQIKVETTKSDLKVLTRKGYYAAQEGN